MCLHFLHNTVDEYAYLLQFVPNDNSARFIHFHSESVLLIYSHEYVNLLQSIITNIEIKRVRWVFQISLNNSLVSGFEVIALHDEISTLDCSETFIYSCHIVEIDSCPLFLVLYNYMFNCLRPELSKINAISYKRSARETVTSSNATYLTWGM